MRPAAVFDPADELCHSSHGTVHTPAAGLEQNHGDKSKYGGGQHNAVKAKGKLGNARVQDGSVVCPVPGNLKGPDQLNDLCQVLGAGKHQPGIPEHLKEHGKKENKESVAEPFAFHPFWHILSAGKTESSSQQSEELASSAVTVAVALCSPGYRDDQGDKEAEKAQPGKKNIKKSKYQISQ